MAASVTGALALTGCSTASGSGSGETISVNAFSVMEAANVPVFEDFQGPDDGDGVEFRTSYGPSGDQSRAVVSGADADVVHYSFVTKLLDNTIALPGSAREATTAFTDGSGDVLLSYENEAILAKQNDAEIDYVVPPDTLLIENPAAVTTDAGDQAKAFLDFMTSPEAQADYAQSGFRPVADGVEIDDVDGANDPADPFPAVEQLWTIDETFNGWAEAADKYFGDGEEDNPLGSITELQQTTGQVGEE